MKAAALFAAAALCLPSAVIAQPVPEGIHREGDGRADLCGMRADNIASLRAQIVGRFPSAPGNDRYAAYYDEANSRFWNFTTEAHAAHPAAACRTLVQRDGQFFIEGEISCQSTRANCDALYREFEELNATMRRELQARTGN
jgi:hypothetical protein